jgi:hypothetical protein
MTLLLQTKATAGASRHVLTSATAQIKQHSASTATAKPQALTTATAQPAAHKPYLLR